MSAAPQKWEFWRHAIGVAACLALGWFGVIVGARIPIVADASFGFHELGHLFTWFLPDVYRTMMGSLFQVIIPVGLAGYFLLFHRDLLGVAFMVAWTGLSAHEVSRYVADAPFETIKFAASHTVHDWAFALGPSGLDRLSAADELAWTLQAIALACVFISMGVAAWGAVRAILERPNVDRAEAYLVRKPVFEPQHAEARPEDRTFDSEWGKSGPLGP
jgi:hypothetical protein